MNSVSVVLPTYNGAKYIRGLLEKLFLQRIPVYELVIIDSGSSDGTLDIITEFINEGKPIKLNKIEKKNFSHSGTRNQAASLCSGDIILFTVQDAEPLNEYWLENMLEPFNRDDSVAMVFCRHVARSDANPLIARDIESCFNSFQTPNKPYTIQKKPESDKEYSARAPWYWFNSDVCSAVRREVFQKVKFKPVPYAEDQILGKELIELGYTKVYSDNAVVIHSHQYTVLQFMKRYFDENRGLKLATGKSIKVNLVTILPKAIWYWVRDIKHLLRSKISRKLYWISFALAYHFVRQLGFFLGRNHQLFSANIQRHLSLEGTSYDRLGNRI